VTRSSSAGDTAYAVIRFRILAALRWAIPLDVIERPRCKLRQGAAALSVLATMTLALWREFRTRVSAASRPGCQGDRIHPASKSLNLPQPFLEKGADTLRALASLTATHQNDTSPCGALTTAQQCLPESASS
jgi:hypothetical protein